MGNTSSIFGIRESSAFARALAESEGIKVVQGRGNVEPYSKEDGSIVIGTPSIYNHKEYMGTLHKEISKQRKDMSFFFKVPTDKEKDPLQHLTKGILQAQRTEYSMHGEYQGRDRILLDTYKASISQELLDSIAPDAPTISAMLYLGNELRNEWQGYIPLECPKDARSEAERLEPILRDRWLQLKDEESLETLLKDIMNQGQEEEEEQGEGNGEPEGEDEGSMGRDGSGGEGDRGTEGESEVAEEGAEGTAGDNSGTEEGCMGGSPDDSGSEGGDEDPESGTEGTEGDASGGQPEAEGSETDSGGQGSEGDSSGDTEGESAHNQSGATGGQDSEDAGHTEQVSLAHNNHGVSSATTRLEDIGLVKDPVKNCEVAPDTEDVPYIPNSVCRTEDLTRERSPGLFYTQLIREHLGSFTLSKKMRKYLISMSQTGYQYGMKKGKICPKNISRIYAGHTQPRIFKQKLTSRIVQDTAIFILGDCSGSMSNERYVTSSCCQISISEVLQTLQIPHMMMQFTSSGDRRKHYLMKRFEELNVSRDILLDRYGSDKMYMGCNADGEAVTEAAQILAGRKENNKLLIVLSDGEPAFGYGNDKVFLKDSVKEIEDSKVMDIVGIGIQSTSVKKYYENAKVVHELEDLEGVLLDLLKDNVLGGKK